MDCKEVNGVDAETKLAIVSSIKGELKDFAADIKAHIDLRIHPIEKDVERLRLDVSDLYEKDRSMRDRVGTLEQRQSTDEGIRVGTDSGSDRRNRTVELSYTKMGLILTGLTIAGGLVGFILKGL